MLTKEQKITWKRVNENRSYIKKNWHKSTYYGLSSAEVVRLFRDGKIEEYLSNKSKVRK